MIIKTLLHVCKKGFLVPTIGSCYSMSHPNSEEWETQTKVEVEKDYSSFWGRL